MRTVSNQAAAKVVLSVLTLCILFGIIAMNLGNSPHLSTSPSQSSAPSAPAPSPVEAFRFRLAVLGAKQLKDSMRNPDSFKLNDVFIMKNNAICYVYRGQNGFGGLNVGRAVISPDGKFKTDEESTGFAALWNRECTKKGGSNQTWQVGYALGLNGAPSNR